MGKYVLNLTVLLYAMAFVGCASVTRGTNDSLGVRTNPPGARVEVLRTNRTLTDAEIKNNMSAGEAKAILGKKDAEFYGPLISTTPASFKLKRKGKYSLLITKPGYEPVVVDVDYKIAGGGAAGMAGDVLVGGLIGVAVDAGTGATLSLTPNSIDIKLKELNYSISTEQASDN